MFAYAKMQSFQVIKWFTIIQKKNLPNLFISLQFVDYNHMDYKIIWKYAMNKFSKKIQLLLSKSTRRAGAFTLLYSQQVINTLVQELDVFFFQLTK